MTAWIEHCKNYAKQNNIPYKQAMKEARASYNPVEGGKFNMKKIKKTVNNISKGAKKASKFVDNNEHYLDFIDKDLANNVKNINNTYKDVRGVSGGKFKLKNALRKTKNTVNRAQKVAKELQPYADMAMELSGSGMCPHCGSGSVSGGSFKAIGGGKMMSPLLMPGFDPKPPKSIKLRQIEN